MKNSVIRASAIFATLLTIALVSPAPAEAKQLRYDATYSFPSAVFRGKAFTFKIRSKPGFNATCTFRTQDSAQLIGANPVAMKNGLVTARFAIVWPLNVRDDGSQWAIITDCESPKAYSAGYAWVNGFAN